MQFPLHVKLYCDIHRKEHIRNKLEKEEILNFFMFHKNFTLFILISHSDLHTTQLFATLGFTVLMAKTMSNEHIQGRV